MYIGALAKLSGASRKAILHYEKLGLIPAPQRKGRYRTYSETDADLICTIKRAQSLGFSLKEITGIVSMRAKTKKLPIDMVMEVINLKRKALRSLVENAAAQDRKLEEFQAELLTNSGGLKTRTM